MPQDPANQALGELRGELLRWPGVASLQPADREDLVQETLQALLANPDLDRLIQAGELTRYAKGVLRNRRALLFRRRLLAEMSQEPSDDYTSPLSELSESERTEELTRVIAQLTPEDQVLLGMRQNGTPFSDIAAELSITPATARQRFVRILNRIRSVYFP